MQPLWLLLGLQAAFGSFAARNRTERDTGNRIRSRIKRDTLVTSELVIGSLTYTLHAAPEDEITKDYNGAKAYCESHGMQLPVPSDEVMNLHFISYSDSFQEGSKVYWVGIEKQDDQWINTYTGDVINGYGGGDDKYSNWNNLAEPAGEGPYVKTKTNGRWLNDDGTSGCTTICLSVSCSDGYATETSATVYGGCEDIDECTDGLDDCHASATCENIPRSYICTCNADPLYEGWTLAYDGPETGCIFIHGTCAVDDESGELDCTCDEGYGLTYGTHELSDSQH